MDADTLDAFRATWEIQRAERLITQAKLDALVLTLSQRLNLEYEPLMEHLRAATQLTTQHLLEKLEDTDPAFAARVSGWLEGEIPNFPLDRPPSAGTPPPSQP
jgi:hypothetical protein